MEVDKEKVLSIIERFNIEGNQICEDEATSTINQVIEACYVPRLCNTEDVPYSHSDFEGVAKNAEVQLCVLLRLLSSVCCARDRGQKFSLLFVRNTTVNVYIVTTEYRDSNWDWSSDSAATSAKNVIKKLCEFCKCESEKEIFTRQLSETANERNTNVRESGSTFLKYILQRLSELLNKKTWKVFPALTMTYWWTLHHLDWQDIGEHLAYLLPPALFITDDWEQRHKVLGLKCLNHILTHTNASELRFYGRAAVIYDAVKPLLHSREPDVLEVLYPTVLEAARVIESDPAVTGKLQSKSCHDVILQQLLLEMHHEQKLELRALYSKLLHKVLTPMGILAVRWSKDLLMVCEDYLATPGQQIASDKVWILKALQVYIRICWPQVHVSASQILKMIVRLMYDITDEDAGLESQVAEDLSRESEIVVQLLHAAAPETTRELCRGLENVSVHSKCLVLLKNIVSIISADKNKEEL